MTAGYEGHGFQALSRRRFGALVMGTSTFLLTGGCATLAAQQSALPPGVGPVGSGADYKDGLLRSTPEAQGISSDAILSFLSDVESAGLELHSLMLMRNQHVVAEGWWRPYRPDRVHMTHSLTKSVTATAVGLAISEGRFGLDDRVASFFPEHVPANASENMRAMTVRDLLTMESGHDHETSGSVWRPIETSWVAEFFKIPVVYKPGTHFQYTSAASFMLSAIISKTTGQAMSDYLVPRFFEPLDIDRWRWGTSPGGISPGGNGLSWNNSASLKLGALHEQMGLWNGNRILPEEWVRAATTKQSDGDADGAYGYHWWMGPGSAYYAIGLFTQMSIVFPEHNAVLSYFSAIDGSKHLKPHVWKHFPAAFGQPTLPAGAAAVRLRQKTADLRLLPPLTATSSPVAARVSGKRFVMQPNDQAVEWVSFDFAGGACTYRMRDEHGEHRVASGLGEYLEQDSSVTGHRLHHEYRPPKMRVVAGARWLSPDRLEMTWQFVETAFRDTVVCIFTGNGVTIDRSVNLNTAETRLPLLKGSIG